MQHLTVRAGGLRDSAAYAEARVWEGPLTAREVILEMTADIGDANAWTTLRLLPTPRESELSIDGEPHRGAGAVNLQSSLHHVVEVSAPDHEDWVRGFEGTVGQLAVSAILTPIRTGPSLLTLTVEPEGATIYAEQLRHGSPGATEIGTTAVQGREFDAGRYRLTFDLTTEEGRARGRVEVDLEPGTHHVLGYRLEEGGATSTRDDRIPIASP